MLNLSGSELQAYETLNKYQGARIEFKCDQVTYQGIVDVILPDSHQVRLRHTKIVEENKYLGNLRFRFIEISSFRVVESVENVNRFPKNDYLLSILRNNRPVQNDTISKALYGDKLSVDEDADEKKEEEQFVLDIPEHLECRLPKDYTVIENLNEDFYQAIHCITGQQIIGVSVDGPEVSRFGKLSWICISTEVCLFLFDMQLLENTAFDNGLREIFESKSIKKVIHDCRFPSDCLAHLYSTVLTNVFDTRVTDFVVNIQRYNDKYGFNSFSSLDCCLRNYLNVPQEFLFNREPYQSSSNQEAFFNKRPISNAYLYDLIKSVLYLKLLHEKLSKELLAPLYSASNFYCTVLNKACKEVIDTLEGKISKPNNIPPGLLMHGIQTVCFQKPEKISKNSLACKFIDPHTQKIIGSQVILHSSTSKDQNRIKISSVFDKENEFCEVPNQKDPLLRSTIEEVENISVKPSFRCIDDVYHKLINRMYPNQLRSAAKPINSICTFSAKQPSSSQKMSVENRDLNDSSDISVSEIQVKKDFEQYNEIGSEKDMVLPTCYKKRNIRFVPG